jgi:hypothetical protein
MNNELRAPRHIDVSQMLCIESLDFANVVYIYGLFSQRTANSVVRTFYYKTSLNMRTP